MVTLPHSISPAIDQLYPRWESHTLWSRFEESCSLFSDRQFFVFEEGSCTYQQAYTQARQTAKALLALGVKPRDHVALLLHNRPEYILLTFALAAIGAVKVSINANIKSPELSYVLDYSDAAFLFSETQSSAEQFTALPCYRGAVLLSDTEQPSGTLLSWSRFLANAHSISDEQLQQRITSCRDPSAVADIMFTSGSTSKPKGVLITHEMLLRSSFASCRCRMMEQGRRIFVPIALYHLMAYNEDLLQALYIGGAVIMSQQRYDVLHCLDMMKQHRVNDIVCVSSIMMDMLTKASPTPAEYPDLIHAYWAASCPSWVWQAGRERFGLVDVTTGYGMTECGSTTTLVRPDDPAEFVEHCHGRRKAAGVAGAPEYGGHLLEIRICDDNGRELPYGECGEIRCRGPVVTPGYYKAPKANASAFTADGWFCTGDLGRIDREGVLTYMGRNSDTYKINGENVSPQFLDCIIGACPQVNAVETVGILHPKCGEVGVAFVEPSNDREETKKAIQSYCKTHLAKFQIPKYFIYSNSRTWPRTGLGKVKKNELREYAAKYLADPQAAHLLQTD